jgi:hypothetical protein
MQSCRCGRNNWGWRSCRPWTERPGRSWAAQFGTLRRLQSKEIDDFAGDPHSKEDFPPGTEGDGELPLRASSVDATAGDFPEADEGLWGKSVTHNGESNREAESSGQPLAGIGADSGSGDDRPSACSRAPRRARTPPDRADPRHTASKASMRACMPPGYGDANHAISRAKIRDTGSAGTGRPKTAAPTQAARTQAAPDTAARAAQPAAERA